MFTKGGNCVLCCFDSMARNILTQFCSVISIVILVNQVSFVKTSNEVCFRPSYASIYSHDTYVCSQNKDWVLSGIGQWQFSTSHLKRQFPLDKELSNFVRQVRYAVFSVVKPEPLRLRPQLAAYSATVLTSILDLDPNLVITDHAFLKFVNGDLIKENEVFLAHR